MPLLQPKGNRRQPTHRAMLMPARQGTSTLHMHPNLHYQGTHPLLPGLHGALQAQYPEKCQMQFMQRKQKILYRHARGDIHTMHVRALSQPQHRDRQPTEEKGIHRLDVDFLGDWAHYIYNIAVPDPRGVLREAG